MRVLITGASGFLGSALIRQLSNKVGVEVIAAVRAKDVLFPAGVATTTIQGVDTKQDWTECLNDVEVVVHCAARVHVMRENSDDPLKEFRAVNVDGTMNLAAQAVKAGVRRFVFISSIGVNGGTTEGRPFFASDVPAPHTPYAVSKHEAEAELLSLAEKTDLEIVIIRPPLIYGPDAPGNFASLMKFLRLRLPLPFGAVVENRRSFIFIENMTNFIDVCIDNPAAADQTFLVSDGESLSTAALLRRMGDALGQPAKLIPVPVRLLQMGAALLGKREMAQRLCGSLEVDISKTRELLGWRPRISVDEGLRRTAEHWLATEGLVNRVPRSTEKNGQN